MSRADVAGPSRTPRFDGSMDRRLVILDLADPMAPSARSWLRSDSGDTFITADSAESCAWLASVTGLDIQSARHLRSEDCTQASLEAYARQACAERPFMHRDVDVAPSVEYGLVLALVSALRDMDVCSHVTRLRRSGAAWTQAVLLTDRLRTRGLVRCLRTAAGTPRVRVVRLPQRRYVDAMLELPRPGRQSLQYRAVSRTPAEGSAVASQAVAVAQRLVRFIDGADSPPSPAVLTLPDGVWDLLLEYILRRGPRQCGRLLLRARARASDYSASAANYLAGVEEGMSDTDVSALCHDYVHPLCSSGLLRGALGADAMHHRASTADLVGILVWNDVLPHHRAMVDAARHLGVRTAMWQHGVFALRTMHDRPRVDLVAVWGETSKRWLVCAGFPEERIRSVGAPSIAATAVGSRTSLGRCKTRVLYTSEGYVGMRLAEDLSGGARTLHFVADASAAAGCLLTAKAHPIEATRAWGSGLRNPDGDLRLCLSTPMNQLLRDTDVLVSRTSTTVLEALLSGLPVLLLRDGDEGCENPYVGLEGVRVVSDQEGLIEALADLGGSQHAAPRGAECRQPVMLSDLLCAAGAPAQARLRDLVAQELAAPLSRSEAVR
jgi:hypothetical protein